MNKNKYIKYPRTYHLPWSNTSSDDKQLDSVDHFVGKHVVVTEKLDGENTSCYNDYFHARSIEEPLGEDRSHAKAIWSNMKHLIPDGWRACCENVAAKHSIHYTDLSSFLQVFSIWDHNNMCLSWSDTVGLCEEFGLVTVPVFYEGVWDEELVKKLWNQSVYETVEGYVVRNAGSFHYNDFKWNVAKFVRPKHVQTTQFWRNGKRVWNQLKEG